MERTGLEPDLPDQRRPLRKQVAETWKRYPLLVVAVGTLWIVVVVLLIAAAIVLGNLASRAEVRSQICRSFELQHQQEIEQVVQTYKYLQSVPADQLGSALNVFVIRQLPRNENIARSDQDATGVFVPKFCDAPNVGLPEPDPKLPPRPADVNRIIHESHR